MSETSGTDLYREVVAHALDDTGTGGLMVEFWSQTPWMVNAYTGDNSPEGQARGRKIRQWCTERYGWESLFPGAEGKWQRGAIGIFGWTWMGFATEAMMTEFLAAWPPPEGVEPR